MDDMLHLRRNIQVEPLVDRWYAWSHLIPPATMARNLTERHVKIMDSYVNAPQVHASAVKNPKLLGGPFIDYGGQRVDEIRELRERTRRERADMVALSQAIGELNDMLMSNAKGFSLQPLYERIPPMLRGYIELFYDLNNQPGFRLLEPLLYRSSYYHPEAQSLALSTITGDERPFVLSTPRLDDPQCVTLDLPFADARVDDLFRLKTAPATWSAIRDRLGVPDAAAERLRPLFTPEPPSPYGRYDGPGIRWRYFGHACILVESRGVSILLDPVLSYTYENSISRYTYLDLPDRIDYVLITHNHQDHILFETLLQLRHKIGQIVVPRGGPGTLQDPSLKLLLHAAGFPNVVELGELESLDIAGGQITGVPFFGEHSDLAVTTKLAYCVNLAEQRLLFAADSCNIEPELYKHLQHLLGPIQVLFLGMECDGAPLSWLYGPLLVQRLERAMDHARRLSGSDYQQAIDIVERFGCEHVYVYAMGQEPWLNYVMSIKYTDQSRPIVESNRLVEECRRRGIVAERLFGEKEIVVEHVPA